MIYLESLLKAPDSEAWTWPLAYSADGTHTFSLAEVWNARPAIKSPNDLDEDEWRRLVLARMSMTSRYQFVSPEGFVANPQQARVEIEARSTLGEQVIRSKREYIVVLLREIYGHAVDGPASP